MRQFDVYENPSARSREVAPFLVALSSHYLLNHSEAVVAPLVRRRRSPVPELELAVSFADERRVLVISDLSSLDRNRFKGPAGSLLEHEAAIRRALERLFTGF